MDDQNNIHFSNEQWVKLLSEKHSLNKERVIVTGKMAKTFRIRKDDWNRYFTNFAGIEFKQGKEIEMIPKDSGDSKVKFPQWLLDRFTIIPGNHICVTERRNRYYMKKMELSEQSTAIPGLMVIDTFEPNVVKREYTVLFDAKKITTDRFDQLLSKMGKFRNNPILPFKTMPGRMGILARRDFLGGLTKEDKIAIRDNKRHIKDQKNDNGSWDENTMTTAFNLMRLLEFGASMKDESVEKAVNWLLLTPEPLGSPGLFMLTEKHVHRFNDWKEKQKPGKTNSGLSSTEKGRKHLYHTQCIEEIQLS